MSLHTLMFGWEYPPKHSGGLGVACQGLVRGLLHHNIKVTLVLPSAVDAKESIDVVSPTLAEWLTVQVPSNLQPYDSFATFEERTHSTTVPASMQELYGPDLGQAVEKYTALAVDMTKHVDPDVIHCHDWMTYEAGIRTARYHRKPLIAHVHATELDRTDFHPNPWIAQRERTALLRCDKIVAVSNYTKNMLTTHYGIAADKIAVVHNGHDMHDAPVQPSLIARQGKKKLPLVLFLGRMTVQKNPWQFLEIANLVRKHNPDVRFVMAGDGPMLSSLIERACAIGLQNHVMFTGRLDQSEVQSLLAAGDCFVMPSLSEPFGLVALEASAHGIPIIVSKQSGAAEVLSHAFTVNYWDADLMADCILTILREQPLAQQLKAEAPKILQKLTWKNQAGAVRSIYDKLLSF